jgi:hypothetical protein
MGFSSFTLLMMLPVLIPLPPSPSLPLSDEWFLVLGILMIVMGSISFGYLVQIVLQQVFPYIENNIFPDTTLKKKAIKYGAMLFSVLSGGKTIYDILNILSSM